MAPRAKIVHFKMLINCFTIKIFKITLDGALDNILTSKFYNKSNLFSIKNNGVKINSS